MGIRSFIRTFYIRSTGYSYTNLGRLFLRMFVGIMLIQFAVRHIATYSQISATFPAVLGLSSDASLILMICVETICSIFIMFGLLTRLMTLPPFVAMIIAEYHCFTIPSVVLRIYSHVSRRAICL